MRLSISKRVLNLLRNVSCLKLLLLPQALSVTFSVPSLLIQCGVDQTASVVTGPEESFDRK